MEIRSFGNELRKITNESAEIQKISHEKSEKERALKIIERIKKAAKPIAAQSKRELLVMKTDDNLLISQRVAYCTFFSILFGLLSLGLVWIYAAINYKLIEQINIPEGFGEIALIISASVCVISSCLVYYWASTVQGICEKEICAWCKENKIKYSFRPMEYLTSPLIEGCARQFERCLVIYW